MGDEVQQDAIPLEGEGRPEGQHLKSTPQEAQRQTPNPQDQGEEDKEKIGQVEAELADLSRVKDSGDPKRTYPTNSRLFYIVTAMKTSSERDAKYRNLSDEEKSRLKDYIRPLQEQEESFGQKHIDAYNRYDKMGSLRRRVEGAISSLVHAGEDPLYSESLWIRHRTLSNINALISDIGKGRVDRIANVLLEDFFEGCNWLYYGSQEGDLEEIDQAENLLVMLGKKPLTNHEIAEGLAKRSPMLEAGFHGPPVWTNPSSRGQLQELDIRKMLVEWRASKTSTPPEGTRENKD